MNIFTYEVIATAYREDSPHGVTLSSKQVTRRTLRMFGVPILAWTITDGYMKGATK